MQDKEQKISPIKQRILQFVDTLGISKRDFYANTGISRGTLESKTGITEETITKLFAIYDNISSDWLLTGAGNMIKQIGLENSNSTDNSCKVDCKVSCKVEDETPHSNSKKTKEDENAQVNAHLHAHLNSTKGENETESAILPVINQLLSKIEEKDVIITKQAMSIGALQKEVEMLQKGFRAKGMDSIASGDVEVAEHANAQQ